MNSIGEPKELYLSRFLCFISRWRSSLTTWWFLGEVNIDCASEYISNLLVKTCKFLAKQDKMLKCVNE